MEFNSLKMNTLQNTIFKSRYALPDEDWDAASRRVAQHLSKAEINGSYEIIKAEINDMINTGRFIPGGRIMHGSGRKFGSLLNCHSLGVDDNRMSIAKLVHDMYLITTVGGGVGVAYDKIRPKGDPIQNIDNQAPGVVNEIEKIDEVAQRVKAVGDRGPAMIASLTVNHPEIVDFINAKLEDKKLTNHNISVGITRKFVDAVKNNKEWVFNFSGRDYYMWKIKKWNDEYEQPKTMADEFLIHGTTKEKALEIAKKFCSADDASGWYDQFECIGRKKYMAKDLWDLVIVNNLTRGEPGIQMIDNIEENFATSYCETFNSSNPCGEAMLPAYGNCCLGSLILSNHYNEKTGEVDWDDLADAIRVGVRTLDNVLEMNIYPIPECREAASLTRRIGIGVMGWHHLLIKLGLVYGSKKSLAFADRMFHFIKCHAFEASIELAQEKGAFPAFNAEKYLDNPFIKKLPSRIKQKIKKYGIRNAVLLSIAPTGTISMVAGTSSGIEPIFAPVYERKFRNGGVMQKELVVDSMFADKLLAGEKVDHIVGAYDITPEEHLAMQTTIQDHIDQAISKTINIPMGSDIEQLSDAMLDFTEYGKGATVYPQGSRGDEPLTPYDYKRLSEKELLELAKKYSGVAADACATGSCDF